MRLKPKAKESGEPVFIRNSNKASKGREGWELQNFRTVEVFQLSNTARNEKWDFYYAFYSPSAIPGYANEKNIVLLNRTCT